MSLRLLRMHTFACRVAAHLVLRRHAAGMDGAEAGDLLLYLIDLSSQLTKRWISLHVGYVI